MSLSIGENNNEESKVNYDAKQFEVVKNILHDEGILNYEDRVVHQLLYFTYNHVSAIVENALTVSRHADKKELDILDVSLALNMFEEKHSNTKHMCKKISFEESSKINKIPLPKITKLTTLRLPSHALTAANYKLKSKEKEQFHYSYQNEAGPVIVPSTSSTLDQRLLKRRSKMCDTVKNVFQPSFNMIYETNPESLPTHLKKKKDNLN